MTRFLRLAAMVALTAATAQASERPIRARLCPDVLPEGVRLPPQPGCSGADRRPPARRDGLIVFGDGTTLRVGGRASAAFGAGR